MNNAKKLQIILGMILSIVIIFLLYSIFFTDKLSKSKNIDPDIVQFDTITTNIQGGDYNYLKVDLSLQAPNKTNTQNLKKYKKQIRRTLINIAISQDGKTLLSTKGKDAMKEQIKHKIKRDYGVDVKGVYFSNFVMAD